MVYKSDNLTCIDTKNLYQMFNSMKGIIPSHQLFGNNILYTCLILYFQIYKSLINKY